MLKRLQEARKNEKGFTLIELLIVIVILGVLAGIVVFAVAGITDRGKSSACKSDVKNVEIAQEAFYAQSTATPPVYAASVDALVTAKLLREAPPVGEGITTDTTGAVAHTCTFT
jgi:general secretion pathway protein G